MTAGIGPDPLPAGGRFHHDDTATASAVAVAPACRYFRIASRFMPPNRVGEAPNVGGPGLPFQPALAEPHRCVVCFSGDGSIMMNIPELAPAAEQQVFVRPEQYFIAS